jgi:hypothetical protein
VTSFDSSNGTPARKELDRIDDDAKLSALRMVQAALNSQAGKNFPDFT